MIVRITHVRENTWYRYPGYVGREYEVEQQEDWYAVKSTMDSTWTLSIHKDDAVVIDWREECQS